MLGRGKIVLITAMLLCLAGSVFARSEIAVKNPLDRVSEDAFSILCQDDSKDKDLNYANYFSRPDEQEGVISVFYNNLIDKEDAKQFGYALLYGLDYAYENIFQAQSIAVGIYFTNGTGKIYFLPKSAYEEFRSKKIGTAQMFEQLTVKDVPLQ